MNLGQSPFQIIDPLDQADIGDHMQGDEKNDGVRRRRVIRYAAWTVVIVNLVIGAAIVWPGLPRLEDQIECRQVQFVLALTRAAPASEKDCLERRARERTSSDH